MTYQPPEVVKRIQGLLETLDQKKSEVTRLDQDMNRMKLALGEATKALDNTRRQLLVELQKLDEGIPEMLEASSVRARKAS